MPSQKSTPSKKASTTSAMHDYLSIYNKAKLKEALTKIVTNLLLKIKIGIAFIESKKLL